MVAEALTNVARHSGAGRASVDVRMQTDRRVVAVLGYLEDERSRR
ncbi:hypothetical protein [Actinoplanes sp. NBRC 101535]|nr:hypothetical protein [Actinoplanes sp. NBRC 101535]